MITMLNKNLTLHKSSIAFGFWTMFAVPLVGAGQKCSYDSEVETFFTQLKNNGFNEQEPVDYHYFFIDGSPDDIMKLKDVLIKQNYQYVGVAKIRGRYQLEVSKNEAHTAGSAIERRKELKTLAANNNVEVFDGFEVKLNNENTETADFREEIEKIPNQQLFKKALEFYNRNDIEKALAAFDRCVSLGINPEASYYKRGTCKANMGNVNGAIVDMEYVVYLNPKHYEANFNLGNLYLDKEHYDNAINYYQKAVTVNSKNDVALYRLAEAYQKKGMKEKALQYCEKSLAVNPDNPYAKELLKKLN